MSLPTLTTWTDPKIIGKPKGAATDVFGWSVRDPL
jgi:hypothetical protein